MITCGSLQQDSCLWINVPSKLELHWIMSIKNIKASFILDDKVNTSGIFKQNNVVYTIYPHVKSLVNVTGIKSFEQLEIAKTSWGWVVPSWVELCFGILKSSLKLFLKIIWNNLNIVLSYCLKHQKICCFKRNVDWKLFWSDNFFVQTIFVFIKFE